MCLLCCETQVLNLEGYCGSSFGKGSGDGGDGAPKKGLGTAQLLDTELGDLVLGQVGPG